MQGNGTAQNGCYISLIHVEFYIYIPTTRRKQCFNHTYRLDSWWSTIVRFTWLCLPLLRCGIGSMTCEIRQMAYCSTEVQFQRHQLFSDILPSYIKNNQSQVLQYAIQRELNVWRQLTLLFTYSYCSVNFYRFLVSVIATRQKVEFAES